MVNITGFSTSGSHSLPLHDYPRTTSLLFDPLFMFHFQIILRVACLSLMVCSHCATLKPIQTLIKMGCVELIAWRCSYYTEIDHKVWGKHLFLFWIQDDATLAGSQVRFPKSGLLTVNHTCMNEHPIDASLLLW